MKIEKTDLEKKKKKLGKLIKELEIETWKYINLEKRRKVSISRHNRGGMKAALHGTSSRTEERRENRNINIR